MEQERWVLPLKDGTTIDIPGDKIAEINRRLEQRQPIRTLTRTILPQDIAGGPKHYVPPVIDNGLAEEAAIAFHEPMIDDNDNVQCVWVKHSASPERWNKYYSQFACFYKLGNNYDKVLFAFRLPVQMLDDTVEKCNASEVLRLDTKLSTAQHE